MIFSEADKKKIEIDEKIKSGKKLWNWYSVKLKSLKMCCIASDKFELINRILPMQIWNTV